ncbi:MAG: hypothetical protein ACTSQE_10425 [Candidatus Heimdallarchaeaceae archaeon]
MSIGIRIGELFPMDDDNLKKCPKCGGTMIKKYDYLPDDLDLKEPKNYWLCASCMYYELME